MSFLLAPRYWGAHLLMVLAVAAAVLLGMWQLHVWEAARASEAQDLSNAKALPLAKVMTGDSPFNGKYLGQPVSFEGEWLSKGTLYVADRDLDGQRGYWVTTPVLVGDSAMPVVRGWSQTKDVAEPRGEVDPPSAVASGGIRPPWTDHPFVARVDLAPVGRPYRIGP